MTSRPLSPPTTDKARERLAAFRRLLVHLKDVLAIDIGMVLWDGSTIPETLAPDALAVAVTDEGAVAGLVRKPGLDTLLNLLVAGRIEIRNGWLTDLVLRKSLKKNREIIAGLDKGLLISTLAKFLFVPRGGPWPLEGERGDTVGADGSEAVNKANVRATTTTSPTSSTPSSSTRRWSTAAAISTTGRTTSPPPRRTSSTSSAASCA